MTDVSATIPTNTAGDPPMDDGEEEESKVCGMSSLCAHTWLITGAGGMV